MVTWFSRRTVRDAPVMTCGLVLSLIASTAIILYSKSSNGTYLGCLTDHFHHARATWNFFNLGFDVYKLPHGVASARVPYPQGGATWESWPVAYPPGMFLVFAPLALLGRYVVLREIVFGKVMIAYLTLIMHAALWGIAVIARRRATALVMVAVAFVWVISLRNALLGFYEGAWLLTGALAVDAMIRQRHARALAWFVASALLSYRAVCFVPLATVSLWEMARGGEALRTKLAVVAFGMASGAVVLLSAWAGAHYGPQQMMEASPLLPLRVEGWTIIVVGTIVAVLLAWATSPLVGVTILSSTALAILHGGAGWHAMVCAAPLFAFVLARRRPTWAQATFLAWLVFYIQKGFWTPPLLWLDELVRLINVGGTGLPSCG